MELSGTLICVLDWKKKKGLAYTTCWFNQIQRLVKKIPRLEKIIFVE